jgi:hypothetical protein
MWLLHFVLPYIVWIKAIMCVLHFALAWYASQHEMHPSMVFHYVNDGLGNSMQHMKE